MEITELEVPSGIRYISEWKDYTIPKRHCIIDKDICGCGYTEYCISPETPLDIILCSPRVALLENKVEQHPGDPGIYYYKASTLKEKFSGSKTTGTKEHNREVMGHEIADSIRNHLMSCRSTGRYAKYLCTYDSFHTISEALGDLMGQFHVVVDEFQSIFLDSFFKANVENDFYSTLQGIPNVAYLSATPMLEKYLKRIDGFKNLPYYKLIWPTEMITKAFIQEKWVPDVVKEALSIIGTYKGSPLNRPWKEVPGGVVQSQEVVFYVNSLKLIKNIITKASLEPSEVNIICADTQENRQYLRTIRKDVLPKKGRFGIGKIPGRGEPHKMFTFCTRTTYLGADFYSTNAITVILSDANVQSLVLDIRLDLPQILGRQRLPENPWKNECLVFYKTLDDGSVITEEAFKTHVSLKDSITRKNINFFNTGYTNEEQDYFLSETFSESKVKKGLTGYYYSMTYDGRLVYNDFLVLAEERAFELTQKEYKSNISVIQSIGDTKYTEVTHYSNKVDQDVQAIIDNIKSLKRFDEKFRVYCEFREAIKDNPEYVERTLVYYRGTDMENLYSHFGIDRCRASKYRALDLKRILSDEINQDKLTAAILGAFKLKEKYTLKDIKMKLTEIYTSMGIHRNPKASDIETYYNTKKCQVTDSVTRKRDTALQLISIK